MRTVDLRRGRREVSQRRWREGTSTQESAKEGGDKSKGEQKRIASEDGERDQRLYSGNRNTNESPSPNHTDAERMSPHSVEGGKHTINGVKANVVAPRLEIQPIPQQITTDNTQQAKEIQPKRKAWKRLARSKPSEREETEDGQEVMARSSEGRKRGALWIEDGGSNHTAKRTCTGSEQELSRNETAEAAVQPRRLQ